MASVCSISVCQWVDGWVNQSVHTAQPVPVARGDDDVDDIKEIACKWRHFQRQLQKVSSSQTLALSLARRHTTLWSLSIRARQSLRDAWIWYNMFRYISLQLDHTLSIFLDKLTIRLVLHSMGGWLLGWSVGWLVCLFWYSCESERVRERLLGLLITLLLLLLSRFLRDRDEGVCANDGLRGWRTFRCCRCRHSHRNVEWNNEIWNCWIHNFQFNITSTLLEENFNSAEMTWQCKRKLYYFSFIIIVGFRIFTLIFIFATHS